MVVRDLEVEAAVASAAMVVVAAASEAVMIKRVVVLAANVAKKVILPAIVLKAAVVVEALATTVANKGTCRKIVQIHVSDPVLLFVLLFFDTVFGLGKEGAGGGRGGACFRCGQEGHRSADCTNPRKSDFFSVLGINPSHDFLFSKGR